MPSIGAGTLPGGSSHTHNFFAGKGGNAHFDAINNERIGQGDSGNSMENAVMKDVDSLKSFYGAPDMDKLRADLQYAKAKQYSDLSDIFRGQGYMQYFGGNQPGKIVLEKCRAMEKYPIQVMAPLHHTDAFIWQSSELRFFRHVWDRLTEQTVPRTTSYTERSTSRSLLRYGIAFFSQIDFFETQQGQVIFYHNLEQMAVAMEETISWGIVVAFLENRSIWVEDNRRRMNTEHTLADVTEILNKCAAGFCDVQKHAGRVKAIFNTCHDQFNQRSVSGIEKAILPGRMSQYVEGNDQKFMSGIVGEGGITDSTVYFGSRSFSAGPGSAARDPHFEEKSHGGYFTMYNRSNGNDPSKFKTSNLNCKIYDYHPDAFVDVFFADLFTKAGYWEKDKATQSWILTRILGKGLFADWRVHTYGKALELNKSMDLTLNALMSDRMADPYKRRRFIDSLSVLRRDDARIIEQDEGKFSPGLLIYSDNYRSTSMSMADDSELMPDICASTMKRIEDAVRSGYPGSINISERAEYANYVRDNKRKSTYSARPSKASAAVTEDNIFDSAELMEDLPVTAELTRQLNKNTYSLHPEDDTLIVRSQVTAIKRLAPSTHRDARREDTSMTTDRRKSYILSIADRPEFGKRDQLGIEGGTVLHTQAYTQLSKWLEFSTHFSDSKYTSKFLNIVQTTIENEVKKSPYDATGARAHVDWHNLLIVTLSPQISALENDFILSQIDRKFATAFELECVEKQMTVPGTHNSYDNLKDGWAKLSADKDRVAGVGGAPGQAARAAVHEDGQLKLAVANNHGIQLPHDAMAVTMAAKHHVLFNLPANFEFRSMKDLNITGSIKQTRKDALVTSFALSKILQTLKSNDKSDLNQCFADWTGKEVGDRIERHLKLTGLVARPLPSQCYATAVIALLLNQLNSMKEITVDADYTEIKSDVKKVLGVCSDAQISIVDTIDSEGYKLAGKSVKYQKFRTYVHLVNAMIAGGLINELDDPVHRMIQLSFDGLLDLESSGAIEDELEVKLQLAASLGVDPTDPAQSGKVNDINNLAPDICKIYKSGYEKQTTKPTECSWTRDNLRDLLMRSSVFNGDVNIVAHDLDIPWIWGLLCMRTSKTVVTGTYVQFIKGCAKTMHRTVQWMAADDAARFTTMGHMNCYWATVIENPDKVCVVPDVIGERVVSGFCTTPWDATNPESMRKWNAGTMSHASVHIMILPSSELNPATNGKMNRKWITRDGKLPREFNCSEDDKKQLSMLGIDSFNRKWFDDVSEYDGSRYANPQHRMNSYTSRKQNTILFQEAQLNVWNEATGTNNGFIKGTGFFGPYVYDGWRLDFEGGGSPIFKTPDYFSNQNMAHVAA